MPLLRERPSVMPASNGNFSSDASDGELVTISTGAMFCDSSNTGPAGRSRDEPGSEATTWLGRRRVAARAGAIAAWLPVSPAWTGPAGGWHDDRLGFAQVP